MKLRTLFLALQTIVGSAIATPLRKRAPTVILDNATVTGVSTGNVSQYLGIPYAQPPTGSLRFELPQPLPRYDTSFSAIAYGPACPQQALNLSYPPDLPANTTDALNFLNQYYTFTSASEDCLTVNVIVPADATPDSNLPVVVWIFGGYFQVGGTSSVNGSSIVEQSISLGLPVIYVSMNYRVNAFGFLASQEVQNANVGNLGLVDQRQALFWVQNYIGAFGGNFNQVTIWGQGSGAISVALQMLTDNGNTGNLFTAAFMQSGSPLSAGDVMVGQPFYDQLVQQTGCSGASDTLQCLRTVPYEALMNVINQPESPQWWPVVDGNFLIESPELLIQQGSVAGIPFITGDCDDEGTVDTFSALDIVNDTLFQEGVQEDFPSASDAQIQQLLVYYPNDTTQGSPFDTGDANALTPEFKRVAALSGDALYQAPRRFFLQNQVARQPSVWTYISKRYKTLPYIGSFHGSDLLNVYNGSDMGSYLIRFVTNLDPNMGGGSDLFWPAYTSDNLTMLEFADGPVSQTLTSDTYRADPIQFVGELLYQQDQL